MRVLVLGKNGRLGRAFVNLSSSAEVTVVGFDRKDYGPADDENIVNSLSEIFCSQSPSVVINCIAYTDVVRAEVEMREARALNETLPGHLAQLADKYRFKLIHFSTNYVYPSKRNCYQSEDAALLPVSFYAHTKLGGEQAIERTSADYAIFRICNLYENLDDTIFGYIKNRIANNQPMIFSGVDIFVPTPSSLIANVVIEFIVKFANQRTNFRQIYNLVPFGKPSVAVVASYFVENYLDDYSLARFYNLFSVTQPPDPKYAKLHQGISRPQSALMYCGKLERILALRLPSWRKSMGDGGDPKRCY